MRRVIQVIAVVAALSPVAALASDDAPLAGSNRDGSSQTITPSERQDLQKDAKRCDGSCPCGQHGTKTAAPKEEAPRFTDAG